tara:strand:+ start:722 stop:1048 length:327 start_codon:yes stop_codon:yes gene_type:complete
MLLTVVLLSLVLLFSIGLNIFLLWFVWKSIRQIAEYDEELRDLIQVINNFSNHLESVHSLEMFYGDETLRHLMRHAKDIVATFSAYDLLLSEEEEYDDSYEGYGSEEA